MNRQSTRKVRMTIEVPVCVEVYSEPPDRSVGIMGWQHSIEGVKFEDGTDAPAAVANLVTEDDAIEALENERD